MESKASRALAALGSVDELARRFNDGKTRAVRTWLNGESTPAPAKQREIEDGGGPPCSWWKETVGPAEPTAPAPAAVVVAGAATPAAVASEADGLLADVQRLRKWVSEQEGGDTAEQIRHLGELSRMLTALSKLRGVLMSERQILESPHWLTLEARIIDALSPWPDALRAMADTLDAARGAS